MGTLMVEVSGEPSVSRPPLHMYVGHVQLLVTKYVLQSVSRTTRTTTRTTYKLLDRDARGEKLINQSISMC